MSANTVADKFGYEFHGNALQYLKVLASGTTAISFNMDPPSTLVIWIYILNTQETQYIFCKSNIVSNNYIARLCVYIEGGYYWGQVQTDKIKSETPVESGWTMLVVQVQDSTQTYYGNSKTQMRIIAYNGKWRYYNDLITFQWRFDDDDSYTTYFGGMPFYNTTTAREEITKGFCGYMIQIRLYSSIVTLTTLDTFVNYYCKLTTHSYDSCDLCRSQDSNTCLVYDDLTTAGGLFVASYSFDTYNDGLTNLQIINDNGPSTTKYHLQLGYNSTGVDSRDPAYTTYYGLYFQENSFMQMMTALDLDKDFTFDLYLRFDKNVSTDDAYIFTKTYMQSMYYNYTFRQGQHYYGFSLSKDNSAYFFINNTDQKQYCKTYFENLFDPERDLGVWIYLSVSVSEFSSYSTNVCVYKRGWATKAMCKVLLCTMTPHTTDMSWYIGGKSFQGAIKTLHIWNYAKAINVMNYSPLFGLQYETQDQSVETKGDCNAFDPEADKIYLDYCPVCDKYTRIPGSLSTCNSQCPFNYYDSLCKEKCKNDLCEICLGGGPADCQICKPGASKDSTTSLCTCNYADYYLSEDSQYCETCDVSCYGCYGKTNKECYSCESGYIPVTDKDICGSGVCCFQSCQQYSKFYYYSFITNRCLYCGTGKYSLDGFTCTEMVFASIKSLQKDMSKITISFTRPVKHSLSQQDLEQKISVTLSGPRDSYTIIYTIDHTTIPQETLISSFDINIQVQSTLYGIENLSIIFSDTSFLADADQVPFGGPSSISTTAYSYSYLSDSDAQTTQQAGNTAQQSSIISLVVSVGVQFIAGGSVEAMFCLTYMMQICSMLPLMNLYFPSNAIVMFKNIAFVNVNNAFLSTMFTTLFYDEDDFSDNDPVNDNFENVGMQSKQMFMNSPDQLMMWILLGSAYPFILFAKYMFSHLGFLCRKFIDIENMFHFNGMIKAFQQIFLTMMISSILNIIELTPKTKADKVSYYGSYVFLGISGFLFLHSLVFVQYNKRYLTHKKFQHTWGALILNGELKLKHPWHYLYLWTFLLRRTVFAISVVMFRESPKLQLFIYLGSCTFIFLWHLILRPYQDNLLNFFYVFNELILIICGCIMMLFLDASMPEKESNLYGYLMIVIVVLAIVINWCVILPSKIIDGIKSLQEFIKKRDDKIRYQIEKKYLMFDSEYNQSATQVVEKRIKTMRDRAIRRKNKQLEQQQKLDNDTINKQSGQYISNLHGYNQLARIDENDDQEDNNSTQPNQDYFPINREVEGQEALNTLESFREAAEQEEIKQEEIKRARTPLLDETMKVRKKNAPQAPYQYRKSRIYRPLTSHSVQHTKLQRSFTPIQLPSQMLMTNYQQQPNGFGVNLQHANSFVSQSLSSLSIDDINNKNYLSIQPNNQTFINQVQPRSLTPGPFMSKFSFDIQQPKDNNLFRDSLDKDDGIPHSSNDNKRLGGYSNIGMIKLMNLTGFSQNRQGINLDQTENQLNKKAPTMLSQLQPTKMNSEQYGNNKLSFL